MLSKDPVKAHLPSSVRATADIKLYALKEPEDYSQDLKDPRGVQCYLEIPLMPTCHRASELLTLSSGYALKEHEDYYQDLKDSRGVRCNHMIPLKPTFHLVSELLSISRRYALKEHEDYSQDLKDPKVVQSYHQIQLKPTCHRASEPLTLSSWYALKELAVSGFERSQSRAVRSRDPVRGPLAIRCQSY